jgi:glycosyltransferase involved in cell wall biosynthesis
LINRVGNALSLYILAPFVYLKRFRNRFDVLIDSENTVPFFTPLFSMKPKICIMYQISRRVLAHEVGWPVRSLLALLEERIMPIVYRDVPFVAISRDTAADLASHRITKHPIETVYSGVARTLKPGKKSDRPSLVYVGRLKRFKRVDLLIRAAADIRRVVPDLRVHIAGTGDHEPWLRQLAAQLELTDIVRFEGYVSEQRKAELLQSAWAFVMPSAMEGWGIAVLEANACGTCAVGFSVPGIREAIVHEKTGLLVPNGEDLAAPILRLLVDDGLRKVLQAGALEHAAAFSWTKTAANMLRLLTNIAVDNPVSLVKAEEWGLSLRTGLQSVEPLFIQ